MPTRLTFRTIAAASVLALIVAVPSVVARPQPQRAPTPARQTGSSTKAFVVGEIRMFAFDPTTEPGKRAYASLADQGWMECKGQELPYGPKDPYYKNLYDVLGTTWGTRSADKAHPTNFLAPDLRGEFLRGWDHGRGQDPEAEKRILPPGQQNQPTNRVGSSQKDKVRQDVGLTSAVHNSTRGFNEAFSNPPGTGTIVELRGQGNEANLMLAGEHAGPETVPHNVYVFYAIFVGTKVRPEHR